MKIIPRLIRLRDAPAYLGMDRNRFNAEVRPRLTEIFFGSHGVGFDRLALDVWFEDYKARNGRPGKTTKGGKIWGKKSPQDSLSAGASGISKKGSGVKEFERALAQVTSKKRSESSHMQ